MSERYYVVSESELQDLVITAEAAGQGFARASSVDRDLEACRARPVPEWATHFARACPRNLEELVFDSSKEIKR